MQSAFPKKSFQNVFSEKKIVFNLKKNKYSNHEKPVPIINQTEFSTIVWSRKMSRCTSSSLL
jgi:hypothetical protein